jgi:hypothetical protein
LNDISGSFEAMSASPNNDFERRAQDPSPSLLREFVAFLRHNKKWWLLPIIIVGVILGFLLYLGSTAAAPFIYTLF